MTENSKLIYDKLQDIFKNIWEQQKYSEVKNGVILTFNIAILVILIRVCFPLPQFIQNDIVNKNIFIGLVLIFIIHIFYIIRSFFPKDTNKENIKWTNNQINIFYFGDIQKLESDSYLKIVIDKFNIINADINKNVLLDLSNQIVKLAEITTYKYNSFKYSIYRMYIITCLFIIYFLYIYFTR